MYATTDTPQRGPGHFFALMSCEHRLVEAQLGDELLEPRVLVLQLLQLADLVRLQPRVLLAPAVAFEIPLGLTGTPGRARRSGARVGEDNEAVFRGLLGLSADEYAACVADGAIEALEDA